MLSFKYRIYWNLHKKVWSLQDRTTGRVRNHVTAFTLYDAKFVVRRLVKPRCGVKVRRMFMPLLLALAACVMALLPACQVGQSHTTHTNTIRLCLQTLGNQ